MTFIPSSKRAPCPICDRTKDGDCRSQEDANLVLCHSYVQDCNEGKQRSYKFLHPSKDGLWGVWVYQEVQPNGKIKGRKSPRKGPKRQPFYYHDRNGNPLIMVVRVTEEGKKSFYQYKWDGVEYKRGLNDFAKRNVPIYRYSDVQQAISQGKTIFVVEGEGKADALWELGIPATTTIGGSKGFHNYGNYYDDLKDASLVLCPDRDKGGLGYMGEIAKIFPEAKWCYIFPDSPLWRHLPDDGGLDIADWIREGATVETICNAIDDKRDFNSKGEKKSISKGDLISRVKNLELIESPVDRLFEQWDLTQLSGKGNRELLELAIALKSDLDLTDDEWAPTAKTFAQKPLLIDEWLFKGFMKAGRLTAVAAESKMGKSLLHYDWAHAVATGDAWGEFPTPGPKPVIIVQTDEPETDCQERIKARGLDELDNCRVITKFMPQHTPRLKRLMESMGKGGLLILDSLTSINRFSGYSPKDPEYAYFVYELKDLASETGWGIVLITHTNKSPLELGIEKIAGSYAIAAAVSDIMLLYRHPKALEGDTTRLLRRIGGRSGAPKTWKLELNLEDYSYCYQGECDKDGEESSTAEPQQFKAAGRQRILAFLGQHAGRKHESQEIAEAIGMPWERCRLLCGEMFREKLILRQASDRDARAKVYYLPSTEVEIGEPNFEIAGQTISKRSELESHARTTSQPFEIADLKKPDNFHAEHSATGKNESLSSKEILLVQNHAEKNTKNLRSPISNGQSRDEPIDSGSDRFEIAPSPRSQNPISKSAPLSVGDRVTYEGQHPPLRNTCGQRVLTIDQINGEEATCSYPDWFISQKIPLADLRRAKGG